MAHCNTVFHTLAKILPRHEIDRLDKKYGQGDRRRKTSRYVQLIVMLMAQILGLKSLREIEQAQKSKQKRLYHLGVKSPVSRSALSRMNDERSADFFKDVFQQMLQSCKALAPGSQFKLPGVNSLILMDATTIQLCLDVFPWAIYTQTKGALKPKSHATRNCWNTCQLRRKPSRDGIPASYTLKDFTPGQCFYDDGGNNRQITFKLLNNWSK